MILLESGDQLLSETGTLVILEADVAGVADGGGGSRRPIIIVPRPRPIVRSAQVAAKIPPITTAITAEVIDPIQATARAAVPPVTALACAEAAVEAKLAAAMPAVMLASRAEAPVATKLAAAVPEVRLVAAADTLVATKLAVPVAEFKLAAHGRVEGLADDEMLVLMLAA